MGPNRRDTGGDTARLALLAGSEAQAAEGTDERPETDLVFDFTGLHRPDLQDLALILTARLQAPPGDRVWVRALPYATWNVLHALGLEHLFRVFPGPSEVMN
ncbi:MAG: hypothetical protein PVJ02_00390 [Gemmatimonadota bacterium]|jgi:hypothetical protein